MLSLIIVEDEKNIREGLRDCINWDDYEIEVKAEASNGRQAFEYIMNNPVDIILTDVVMPVMDGIQLVEKVRESNMDIKVIFISGYSDIPYLKSALKLDAVDYVLKPIKLTEMDSVLRKVAGIRKNEKAQKELVKELKEKLEQSIPILTERFFLKLFTGELTEESQIKGRIKLLDLPINHRNTFSVMTLEFGSEEKSEYLHIDNGSELVNLFIKEKVEKIFTGHYYIFCLPVSDEKKVAIVVSKEEDIQYGEIMAAARTVQREVCSFTGMNLAIGIGNNVGNISELHTSYQQSLRALKQKYFLGENKIIHYTDTKDVVYREGFYCSAIQGKIVESVCLGKKDELVKQINELFVQIRSSSNLVIEYIQNICLEIITAVNTKLMEFNISNNKGLDRFMWMELLKLETLNQTEDWMKNTLLEVVDRILDIQNSTSRNIVEMMKKTIQQKYADNLTTQGLAEEFFLTPNYICLLFKKETGQTFNEYLTNVRIGHAKQFIRESRLKLYEIAEKIGYRDADYMTKVFKKHTGMTPSEYREKSII